MHNTTLHVPLLPETEGLVNEETLRSFRKGSVLLNFARQPIVDSSALKSALDDGHIGSYIADFPVPEIAGLQRRQEPASDGALPHR